MKPQHFACLGATVLALSCIVATPVTARTPYDGSWSVVIVTERGSCDSAYRYNLAITNGIVSYPGDNSFQVYGRVGKNGAVQVSVARGGQRADGSGQLTPTYGNGRWRGAGSAAECSGRWMAEKR
jgi:hypothetical protein